MTPDEHKMLVEIREATIQNTMALEKMKRANRIAIGAKIFYWLIIIGISFGAFYFIQPYIDTLKGVYSGIEL